MQKAQNKSIRLIDKKSKLDHIYKKYNILNIHELISLENAKFGYKAINNLLPQKVKDCLHLDQFGGNLVKTTHIKQEIKKSLTIIEQKPKPTITAFYVKA